MEKDSNIWNSCFKVLLWLDMFSDNLIVSKLCKKLHFSMADHHILKQFFHLNIIYQYLSTGIKLILIYSLVLDVVKTVSHSNFLKAAVCKCRDMAKMPNQKLIFLIHRFSNKKNLLFPHFFLYVFSAFLFSIGELYIYI